MRFGIVIAIAGAFLCSCTQKMEDDNAEKFVLSAVLPDNQTKTILGTDDGVAGHEVGILWKTGDQVSVNGNLSDPVASGDNAKKLVDFTINGSPSAPYKVLYPGTTSTDVIVLPDTQNYVANSFDGTAAAAYGNAEKVGGKYSVTLHNFCGLVRFAFTGSATLDKIVLRSKGSEKLYGSFTMTTDGSGFTGAFTGGTAGTLTYDCDVTLTNAVTYFYVAIPAQNYASGLEAKVYQSDGAYMTLTFSKLTDSNGDGIADSGNMKGTDLVKLPDKAYVAGRTEEVMAISSLTSESGGNPTVTPPSITVACYNVMRLDDDNRPAAATSGDSNGKLARPANAIIKTNSDMRTALGLAIYNTNADVIGFNEIGDDMYQSGQAQSLQDIVAAQGAQYTWELNFPGSESGNFHYCNGYAYKSSVLTKVSDGKAWLRKNSNSYSTSSSSNSGDPNRFVVWVKFRHKTSGKEFYFFVTQLPTYGQDGGSGTSNLYMSGGVNAFAASKSDVNRRILVGDMNSVDHSGNSNQAGAQKLLEYWTDGYAAVLAAGNLSSFYQTYSGTQSGTADTYQYDWTRFTKNHPERRIDHVMVNGNCTVKSYKTVRNTYTVSAGGYDDIECAPSDHFPVVCEISLDD